jgi:F-type H+-transporting ATPase subunit b
MNIQIQQIVTQILGFLILFWVLRKFAWDRISTVLEERRAKITSDLEEARRGKESLELMRRDYEAKMAEVENRARLRVQEAVVEGQRAAKEIADGAREEAREILEKAKESIEREMAKAKAQLREEIATISVAAAEKIVRQEVNRQKNKELVLKYIDEVKGFK